MEFHLSLATPVADLRAVADAVCALDPSAQVDTTPDGRLLRVSARVAPEELAATLQRAGVPATVGSLAIIPSVCCGGCSG